MDTSNRKLKILAKVVEEYIRTGEPIGSKAIAQSFGTPISSATIRNDMAALEKMGLLEQPHTSAGRVPSYLGYRLYIEQLMDREILTQGEMDEIDQMIENSGHTPDEVIDNCAKLLALKTGCTIVSTNNLPQYTVISKVEVIPTGRRLYALLMVTTGGTVKNKVCRVEFDITHEQLEFFAQVMNENLSGLKIDSLTDEMLDKLAVAMGSYIMALSPLLNGVRELSYQLNRSSVNIEQESKLLSSGDFDTKEIANFLASKNELGQIMSQALDGINVVFGQESDSFAITNSSMVLAKYNCGENTAGAFGVIGPLRLNYAKIIPYIEYFSDSVTRLLSQPDEYDDEDLI